MSSAPDHTRRYSSVVVDGPSRAGARSMLRPVGFTDEDFRKPVVGIASLWSMVTPCNMHIDKRAVEAEAGTNAAGGKAVSLLPNDSGYAITKLDVGCAPLPATGTGRRKLNAAPGLGIAAG